MSDIETPIFHLEKVVKAKAEDMEDFTGPLDLILSLLAKNKMEIKDIQIAVILDQYMDWMNKRKELDLEVASEFVAMAAQLVFIKTRMLLSIHDEEALSEMEQLIASLEEHQRHESFNRIKAVIPTLADRNEVGRDYITKTPEALPANRVYRYVHKGEDLRRAMLAVLERSDNRLPPPMAAFEGIVGREPYPVAEKAGGDPPAAHPVRRDPVPGSVQGQPQPQRDCGHLYRRAGAVPGPAGAPGGHGDRLHGDLHRRGGGGL